MEAESSKKKKLFGGMKHIMRKRTFVIIILMMLLAALWTILFAVDYNAVMKLHDPVIARHVGVEGGTFKGLGWTVEIEKYHSADYGWVTESVEVYLFGKLVGAAIT